MIFAVFALLTLTLIIGNIASLFIWSYYRITSGVGLQRNAATLSAEFDRELRQIRNFSQSNYRNRLLDGLATSKRIERITIASGRVQPASQPALNSDEIRVLLEERRPQNDFSKGHD